MEQNLTYDELKASAHQLNAWIKESYTILEQMVIRLTDRVTELEEENRFLKSELTTIRTQYPHEGSQTSENSTEEAVPE